MVKRTQKLTSKGPALTSPLFVSLFVALRYEWDWNVTPRARKEEYVLFRNSNCRPPQHGLGSTGLSLLLRVPRGTSPQRSQSNFRMAGLPGIRTEMMLPTAQPEQSIMQPSRRVLLSSHQGVAASESSQYLYFSSSDGHYALTLRKSTYTVSDSHAHIHVMQFICCFLRKKPHLLRKCPLRANKHKGQFLSGVTKGSYIGVFLTLSTQSMARLLRFVSPGVSSRELQMGSTGGLFIEQKCLQLSQMTASLTIWGSVLKVPASLLLVSRRVWDFSG